MIGTRIQQKALAAALAAALLTPGLAYAGPAALAAQTASTASQPQQNAQQGKKPAKRPKPGKQQVTRLKGVMVLGSLIPQTEKATATPLTTYTPQEIQAQGFSSFSEFMRHIPQASIVAAPDSQGAERAARPFEMHDLGASRTLLLVDGQRTINYPIAGSLTTAQDLSIIPPGLVQRVEITPTGDSSLYGSDAMNGVADVILKNHLEGDQISVTGGVDTQGGEAYRDFQFFGGKSGNKWNLMYSFEHKATSALFVSQRDKNNNLANAGFGTYGPADRMFGYQYGAHGGTAVQLSQLLPDGTSHFVTPPAGACEGLGFMPQDLHTVATHGTTLGAVTNLGTECVQPDAEGGLALEPAVKSNYVFLHGTYAFTPDLQGFATLSLFGSAVKSGSGWPALGDGGQPVPFYDSSSGQVIAGFTRQLTQAETGHNSLTVNDKERYWNLRAGLDGGLGNFNWTASVSSQKYLLNAHYRAFDALNAFHFFFGPQLGTHNVDGTTYPVYNVNQARFWNRITPAEYATFAPKGQDRSSSVLDTIQFNVNNTSLFNVPWDNLPVGWAGRLTVSHSSLSASPDPRQLQPTLEQQLAFEAPIAAIFGTGTRMHYALGTEFRVPLATWLTWDISGRIDKYNDHSSAKIAKTFATSFAVRPYSGLMLRASYNTTFRAPGLGEINFKGNPSIGTDYADPYECIINNQATCPATQHSQAIEENTQGNPFLKNETGNTVSFGFVWDIPGVKNLSLTADYYREFVRNGISVFGTGSMLTLDAACLTGLQVGGAPFRGSSGTEIVTGKNSPICPAIEAAVPRAANGQLLGVNAIPINVDEFLIRGEDATLRYDLETERLGSFQFRLQYDHVPFEAAKGGSTGRFVNVAFGRSGGRIMWSAVWRRDRWHASLGGLRYSGLEADNWDGCNVLPNGIIPSTVEDPGCDRFRGHTAAWVVFNGAVGYQFTKKVSASLMVHNIFNKDGQLQFYGSALSAPNTEGEYPNGRQVFVTLNYKID